MRTIRPRSTWTGAGLLLSGSLPMDTTQRDPALETLSEGTMAGDPMTQFAGWLAQAEERGIPEPTGMVLATTSADGRPRARTGRRAPGRVPSSPGTRWAAR